jgi:hypothetical protein
MATTSVAVEPEPEQRPDHMELTAEKGRASTLAWATIRRRPQLTPTIVGLELEIEPPT